MNEFVQGPDRDRESLCSLALAKQYLFRHFRLRAASCSVSAEFQKFEPKRRTEQDIFGVILVQKRWLSTFGQRRI
jgi:hypothetical protein